MFILLSCWYQFFELITRSGNRFIITILHSCQLNLLPRSFSRRRLSLISHLLSRVLLLEFLSSSSPPAPEYKWCWPWGEPLRDSVSKQPLQVRWMAQLPAPTWAPYCFKCLSVHLIYLTLHVVVLHQQFNIIASWMECTPCWWCYTCQSCTKLLYMLLRQPSVPFLATTFPLFPPILPAMCFRHN